MKHIYHYFIEKMPQFRFLTILFMFLLLIITCIHSFSIEEAIDNDFLETIPTDKVSSTRTFFRDDLVDSNDFNPSILLENHEQYQRDFGHHIRQKRSKKQV